MTRFREWIDEAWELAKSEFWMLLLATFLAGIVGGAVAGILYGPAMVGLTYVIIKKLHWPQARIDISDLGKGAQESVVVPAILAGLIAVWLPSLGFLVCIGWLFTYPLFVFVPLFVMDRNLQGWDACQASIDVVKKHYWTFVGWYTLSALLACVGSCVILPAYIVSMVYQIVVTLAYRDMVGFQYAHFPELNPQAAYAPAPQVQTPPPPQPAPPAATAVPQPPPPSSPPNASAEAEQAESDVDRPGTEEQPQGDEVDGDRRGESYADAHRGADQANQAVGDLEDEVEPDERAEDVGLEGG